MDLLYFILEITGTVIFAVTGVITAVEKKMDVLGATVLGLVTAVGGGILRDVMLGYLPPVAFRNIVYSLTAIGVSIAVFIIVYFAGAKIKPHVDTYQKIITFFDSVGLAVFTVGGVERAHMCGFEKSTYLCIFVGVLTGVGGGVLRDMMAGKIPGILTKRVYALAAIAGAAAYQLLTEYGITGNVPAIIIGASVVWLIRILAALFRWNLPRFKKNIFEDEKSSSV